MSAALLLFAHPYPERSVANRELLSAVEDLPGLAIRSLYELYPGFDIDVNRERVALTSASLVVWQHPMYWYSVPGLLKHWFDKVLTRGFAYGEGGVALRGKRCLWVTTTGGDATAFQAEGMHRHPFDAFVPAIEQTARFCGMRWEEPFVVHGAHRGGPAVLRAEGQRYRTRLETLLREVAA